MAEVEIELKDEELLDFDGSDYEFGSDEGFGEEEMERSECGQVSNRVDGSTDEMTVAGSTGRVAEARITKSRTELEDGELSDMAAMVNSKKQTEHGVKDVKHSRKTSSATMRELSDREAERNGDSRHDRKRRKDHDYEKRQYSPRERKEPYDRHMGRYDRPYRSDRRHDRYGGFPDARTRGRNAPGQSFRPNLLPGIMGPGGPLRPDVNYQFRPSTAGLEIFSPAQLQELLNQEQILRSQHQMMLQSRFGIRPPGQTVYPNFLRPPLQGSDLGPHFMRPLHLQGTRPNYPGAGILGAAGFGYMGPSNTYKNDGFGPSSARGQPRSDQGNTSSRGEAAGDEFEENGGRKHSTSVRNKQDPHTRRSQDDHQPRRSRDEHESRRVQEPKRSRDGEHKFERDMERRPRSSSERESGEKAHSPASRGNEQGGNFIQLGGPVAKSRVLTVSGFLENTPMSAVAEAFEKQGKILDFRKNQKGDVFTVTFSSVQEALSAKRHLHRSILAGRQITVEYAV